SVGEITTAWQYEAPDSLLAAKTPAEVFTKGSAGGVGGPLMSCERGGATWSYFQDGHGNVCQMVDQSDGSEDVRMEYDAFVRVLVGAPTWALKNAFRFSSKFYDNETGFLYYGYRYYDPVVPTRAERR